MNRWSRLLVLTLVGVLFASSATLARAAEPQSTSSAISVAAPAVALANAAILSRGFLFDLFRSIRSFLTRIFNPRPQEPDGCGCEPNGCEPACP
jgi:hypothetical protein